MLDRRAFGRLTSAAVIASITPIPTLAMANGRRAEAAALVRFAEKTHPRGREAKVDPQWRRLARRFLASAPMGDVSEYIVRAFALLAWFKDGHTTLWASLLKAGPFGLDMPIRVGSFYDGLYITEATDDHLDLLGSRIMSVGGLTVGQLMRRFAAIWPANNIAWPHHDAGLLFSTPGLLHGLGAVRSSDDAAVGIKIFAKRGGLLTRNLRPGQNFTRKKVERSQWTRELWATNAGSSNFIRRLPGDGALYVSFENMNGSADDLGPFIEQIFSAMEESQWSKLILDLRRNPGGDNFLAEPLRKHIERSRFNQPGKFYVLIGPVTFSAAQNLSNRLERETFAVFAGEPTGGAPNHYGDAKKFEPATILQGGVSTVPWFDSYPMDKRPWIMPDILIPRTFSDWAAGDDKVLAAVLAHNDGRPANDASHDRVLYFARKSQSAEWKPFWLD